MKRAIITLSLIMVTILATYAQEKQGQQGGRRRFSPEQFQAKQRSYIVEKAKLTQEEADAFFPLFFELQKEKFRIEHEARSKVIKERGQRLTDEQCKELLMNNADARIKIAELEKEYITKYLKAVSAKKLLDIQRAERSFQNHMLKSLSRDNARKAPKKERTRLHLDD